MARKSRSKEIPIPREPGREETVRAAAWGPDAPVDAASLVAAHQAIAGRLLREGATARALAELVRASREVPMSGALASSLVRVAVRAGTPPVVMNLLKRGLEEVEGKEKRAVRRAMVRLFRKTHERAGALEQLEALLEEFPDDIASRRVYDTLLEEEQRWPALETSLAHEAAVLSAAGRFRRAARCALRRAEVLEQRMEAPDRAAAQYQEASRWAETAHEPTAALFNALLAVRAWAKSGRQGAAFNDAVMRARDLGEQQSQTGRVEAFLNDVLDDGAIVPSRTGRATTHQQLVAVAEIAPRTKTQPPEVGALLRAALDEAPATNVSRQLEAHLIGRGDWRALAQYYRDVARDTTDDARVVETLEKLAEVLESELHDPKGAAEVYAQIASRTGDPQAHAERLRLLKQGTDSGAVREALDVAVEDARGDRAKAAALVRRGEDSAAQRQVGPARRDFEEALRLDPAHVPAALGLLELSPAMATWERARALTEKLPKRHADRADAFRRLARTASESLERSELALWAWNGLLEEVADDEEGLMASVRVASDVEDGAARIAAYERYLKARPRGPLSQRTWRNLAYEFAEAGQAQRELETLKLAARFEPSHHEVWALLAQRMIERGRPKDAVVAYEHRATALESDRERQRAWLELAAFCRTTLKDPTRAAAYEEKARRVGPIEVAPALGEEPASPTLTRLAALAKKADKAPRRAPARTAPRPPPPVADLRGDDEWEPSALDHDDSDEEIVELQEEDIITGESLAEDEPVRPGKSKGARKSQERALLFERVKANPLDIEAHRALMEVFQSRGDGPRVQMFADIVAALSGSGARRAIPPRGVVTPADFSLLFHPWLLSKEAELILKASPALERLLPVPRDAPALRPLSQAEGPGVRSTSTAVLEAQRLFGAEAPRPLVSLHRGPPLMIEPGPRGPMLLVGTAAVERQLQEAELRFFAGRAVFTYAAGLLPLRAFQKAQLHKALRQLAAALDEQGSVRVFEKALRAIPRPTLLEIRKRMEREGRSVRWERLQEGARHTANRAGFLLAGGLLPSLRALKAKRARSTEIVELVRFAASQRFFELDLRLRQEA